MPKVDEEEKKEPTNTESADTKKKAPKNQQKKGADKGKGKKGDAGAQAAEESQNKEVDETAKIKEAEIARKKAEEAARAAYKPKIYTDEEKTEWKAYVDEIRSFFASIVMRQSKQARHQQPNAESASAQGEQPEEAKGEEEKKEELNQEAPAEADPEAKEPAASPSEETQYGDRLLREQSIQYDFAFLCEDVKKVVPEPLWPDPDNEPLPPPLINSI